MATQHVFYTTFVNTSGVEKSFGFLPPHGKRLAPNEQVTVFGNLIDYVARRGRRFTKALENSVTEAVRGAVMSTPGVHLFDHTTDLTKVLALNNNALGVVDPTWGEFSSAGA